MTFYADWTCERASVIKSLLPRSSSILVSTGGGITLQTSLQDWAFSCAAFDIVSAHDYGTDAVSTVAALQAGQAVAKANGKIVLFEEWGASGASKATVVSSFVQALAKAGIPHMVWEIVEPVCRTNSAARSKGIDESGISGCWSN